METEVQFRIRIRRGETVSLGPGKVELLEAISKTGSINAAAKLLNMSYRRAWLLIDALNRSFRAPLVHTAIGGSQGGGTALTDAGLKVIELYRGAEHNARRASAVELRKLLTMLND